MNKNKNSGIFKASQILAIVIGIFYAISVVGLLFAIPLFFASSKFGDFVEMTDEQVLAQKDTYILWSIVFAVICFPIGLIALIPLFSLDKQSVATPTPQTDSKESKTEAQDKMEKIKELYELKQKGIIDEQDFKIAKDKIMNS